MQVLSLVSGEPRPCGDFVKILKNLLTRSAAYDIIELSIFFQAGVMEEMCRLKFSKKKLAMVGP